MKSLGLSYLLWFFGGIIGLHKFYLGRPGMGLLYLCSGGIAGIGWFFDLFTLPKQVMDANARAGFGPIAEFHHYYHDEMPGQPHYREPPVVPADMEGFSPEKQVLVLSHKIPMLTVRQVVGRTRLEVTEAEAALRNLAAQGYAKELVDSDGKLAYDFS
jgi:TM2 domain-containing membrane protein YozV